MAEREWDLSVLYKGFDDPQIEKDVAALQQLITEYTEWASNIDEATFVEKYLDFDKRMTDLSNNLGHFAQLSLSTDSKNEAAGKLRDRLEKMLVATAVPGVKLHRWIEAHPNIEIPEEIQYHIKEVRDSTKYLLSEEQEEMIAIMGQNAGNAWENLHDDLWAEHMVEYNGKKMPLQSVRDLRTHKDPKVRKEAFEAEYASYAAIETSCAAALSAMKGQQQELRTKRGYKSILDCELEDERLTPEILDALMNAVKESLPQLQKYLHHKAKLLGKKALAFYDIQAPMGEMHKEYPVQVAEKIIIENFTKFAPEKGEFAKRAFNNKWIDYYPREGKSGGGFCSFLVGKKESRVLCNHTGTYENVLTIAHELGHAFHNEQMKDELYVNMDYPFSLAETASTFAEEVVMRGMLAEMNDEEKITALNEYVSSTFQTIVDIYSRFLFESRIIEARKLGPLKPKQLCEMFKQAQQEAYGELEVYHDYLWIPKPHYYYSSKSFYNFPYTFGNLYALGLYKQYTEQGDAFVEKYKHMLNATGKMDAADVGKLVGVDFSDKKFWKGSIQIFIDTIEEWIALTS